MITIKEWVLNGDTVMYGAAFELKAALDYDFEMERNFKYSGLSNDEIVKHITFFVSRSGRFTHLVKEIPVQLPFLQSNIFVQWATK